MVERRTTARTTLRLLTLCALMASGWSAAVELPETPAGRALDRWLAAVEAADDEQALREYIESSFGDEFLAAYPLEEHVRVHLSARSETGGLEPDEILVQSPTRIVARAKGRNGSWMTVSIEVEPEPPHKVVSIGFRPADPPTLFKAPPAENDARLAATVRNHVAGLAGEGRFSGAVLVSHRGVPVVEGAWGLASRRYGVSNHVDTRFNLGSMNKMFTAVAVARLVEEGRLGWDDTVGSHLPDYPNAAVRDTVRIRHLLNHTSGMGSHFTKEFRDASKLRFREPADFVPLFADEALAFEPGAQFAYSNAGFYVLGLILEAVTEKSYYDVVQELVYTPAGMWSSGSFEIDSPVPNLAIGYYEEDGEWRENSLLHTVRGGPAGGGYSTVGDLNRFAHALLEGTLVDPATLEVLTTPNTRRDDEGGYGYGFGVYRDAEGVRWFGHSGGFPGINGVLHVYPELGYTVAVLANMDEAASDVARHIRRLLPRPDPAP